MSGAARGRPLSPLNPDASCVARLGAEIRAYRLKRELTQQALGKLISSTPQYISEVERAKTLPTQPFVAACDAALKADGALLDLLPAATKERDREREERAAARRAARDLASLPCGAHSDAGDDVESTNRRGLIGAGASAAMGAAALGPVPAAAGEVDPELPAHLLALLALLGGHDARYGPHEVLGLIRHELRMIAAQRAAARGELRAAIMRVEARWTVYAAWLAHDTGDLRGRDALFDRALHLAHESDYPDVLAWTRARQSQFSDDAPRALRLAEAALRTPRASAHTRALCTVRAAYAHARIGDAAATERSIAEAETLLAQDSPPPPGGALPSAHRLVRCWEARCWSALKPARGVALYESVLRDWPRGQIRDDGLYRARLALVCADAGELDRARAEGQRAFAITKQTRSATAERELKRLVIVLRAA
jgi:transcriptional regulator with XRE-family HTH domain